MGISADAITNPQWARKLWKFSGRDGIVDYWINDDGKSGNLPMSGKEIKYVRKSFRQIDRLTGLEFRERNGRRRTDIDVHCADDLGSGIEGQAVMNRGWFDVYWVDKGGWDLTRGEKWTIQHEIGHAVGLDHPYGSGFHPRYDSSDTVMSYNFGGFSGYTSSDIRALQALWGT